MMGRRGVRPPSAAAKPLTAAEAATAVLGLPLRGETNQDRQTDTDSQQEPTHVPFSPEVHHFVFVPDDLRPLFTGANASTDKTGRVAAFFFRLIEDFPVLEAPCTIAGAFFDPPSLWDAHV
jgi:hypothetical protein